MELSINKEGETERERTIRTFAGNCRTGPLMEEIKKDRSLNLQDNREKQQREHYCTSILNFSMESAYFSLLIEQNWIDPRFLLSSGDG